MPTPLVTCHTSLGNTRTHTRQVFAELASLFPIYFAWGNGPTGDHAAGKALDVMAYADGTIAKPGPIRPGFNIAVKNYVHTHRIRLGVRYYIYDHTIVSSSPRTVTGVDPWVPKAYTGESHTNHVHISFLEDPPAYQPPPAPHAAQEDPMAGITLAQIEATVRNVVREESRVNITPERQKVSGYAKGAYDADSLILDTSWRIRGLTKIVQALAAGLGPEVQASVSAALTELLSADVDVNVTVKPTVPVPPPEN
jgi:hypothetical protein